jgi:hypothetical protein
MVREFLNNLRAERHDWLKVVRKWLPLVCQLFALVLCADRANPPLNAAFVNLLATPITKLCDPLRSPGLSGMPPPGPPAK